jgi:hypothetical protein
VNRQAQGWGSAIRLTYDTVVPLRASDVPILKVCGSPRSIFISPLLAPPLLMVVQRAPRPPALRMVK